MTENILPHGATAVAQPNSRRQSSGRVSSPSGYRATNTSDSQGSVGFVGSPIHAIQDFDNPPQPLVWPLQPVPPLIDELIPGPWLDWITDSAERIGCAREYIIIPALIAASSLLGRSIGIKPKRFDDWIVTANLFGCCIGGPGGKKSPGANEGTRHIERLASAAFAKHQEQLDAAKAGAVVAAAKAKKAKKAMESALDQALTDGAPDEELIELARSGTIDTTEQQAPLKRYIVNDATIEALGNILRDNPRGILVKRDELMGLFNGMERQGHEQDRAFYLEGWNGNSGTFTSDRIGRGVVVVSNVCLSLFGTIQPGPFTRYIQGAASGGSERDGFVSRFQLMVYPDRHPSTGEDRLPDTSARDRAYSCFKGIDELDAEAIGATRSHDREIPTLRFCSGAQELFDDWSRGLEERLNGGLEFSLMEEHLAKYRSLMPKLALLFHVINRASGTSDATSVSVQATMQAMAWCEFLEQHARRIYSMAFDGDIETTQRLAERLKDLPNPFTPRQIQQKGWTGLQTVEHIQMALGQLEEKGWIRSYEPPISSQGGRPTVQFWKHPNVCPESQKEQV